MSALDIFIQLLYAVPWTIALTLGSLLLGAFLGMPIFMLRTHKLKFLRRIAAALILAFRSIPPIVWLFFIYFAFSEHVYSVSPFVAAVIGLGLITSANLAEVYRGAFSSIPAGQHEACSTLGLNTKYKYWDVIAPQVFRVSLPSVATYGIALLKDSAIASVIGVSEVAFVAHSITQATFQGLGVYALAAIFYFAISFFMAGVSRKLDFVLRERAGM